MRLNWSEHFFIRIQEKLLSMVRIISQLDTRTLKDQGEFGKTFPRLNEPYAIP